MRQEMPEKFREFVSDYLYCIIRLMISNMDWVEKVLTWPFEDSFSRYCHMPWR